MRSVDGRDEANSNVQTAAGKLTGGDLRQVLDT